MNDTNERSGDVISQVLTSMRIGTVVCVDDIYSLGDPEESAAIAVAWCAQIASDGKAQECCAAWQAITEWAPSFDVPEDMWKRSVRERWLDLHASKRVLLLDALASLADRDVDIEGDFAKASLLSDLMRGTVELVELAPADWEKRQGNILGELGEEEGTLCLFDHNLEGADGYGPSDGVRLLDRAIEAWGHRRVICGLLTHTVPEGAEIARAAELADELGRRRKDLVLLSKERLSKPTSFAHGLKMMGLNHGRDSLTWLVEDIASEATAAASAKLMDVDIYDFDYMVLRSSEEEGVWEAETLFRLFGMFRRRAFLRSAFTPPKRDLLIDAMAQIRAIRQVPTVNDADVYPRDQRWETRRLELFDNEVFINKAHLPLELGDIFRIGDRKFILVDQPCDLVVRSNGRRLAKVLTLLNITDAGAGSAFALDYFDPDTGNTHYAKFRSSHHVSADLLDLCVFNSEGRCLINTAADPPAVLHPPWKRRYEKVRRRFQGHDRSFRELLQATERANLSGEASRYLKRSLAGRISLSSLGVRCDYEPQIFRFGARRIGRLRQPHAAPLLSAYCAFLSRHAGPHDYTPREELGNGVWRYSRPDALTTAAYVGADHGHRFHKVECPHVRQIAGDWLVCFETPEAATAYSRQRCRVCKP